MNNSDVNTNNRMVYTVDEIAKMLGIGRTAVQRGKSWASRRFLT